VTALHKAALAVLGVVIVVSLAARAFRTKPEVDEPTPEPTPQLSDEERFGWPVFRSLTERRST
jgi:hypothetical protein